MDLKQLNYFITIVNEGNISNAAKKLHLSQPPLSTQIKHLEEELGCLLFERGSRQIQLTEAGKVLYDRANTLLSLSKSTIHELSDYHNGAKGTLKLGVVSSVGSTFLTDLAIDFHMKYPQIRFEISEANTYQLIEQLRMNLIDAALVRTPFPATEFEYHPLKNEPMLAVGHASFFTDIKNDSIHISELSKMPLILYRRWEQILTDIFMENKQKLTYFCKNDDARTTAYWADAGLGVGIIPSSSLALIKNSNTIFKKIEHPGLDSCISIISGKSSSISPATKIFTDYVLHSLQPPYR